MDPTAPIRFAVVAAHEAGHALGALLTGGRVISIDADWATLSGQTVTEGGSALVILAMGPLLPIGLGAAALGARRPIAQAAGGVWSIFALEDSIGDLLSAGARGDAQRLAAMTGAPDWAWVAGWILAGAALWAAIYWGRTRTQRSRTET